MPEKNITMSRILKKLIWDKDYSSHDEVVIKDTYDAMDFDDFVNILGYMLNGHKGQTITIEMKMDKEDENGKA